MKKFFVTYERNFSRRCMVMFAEDICACAHIIQISGNKFISAKEITETEN